MISYHTKARCYDCGRPIMEKLYLERDADPDAYVPICGDCEPTWALFRRMEQKRLLTSLPGQGIAVTPQARAAYFLSLTRHRREQSQE